MMLNKKSSRKGAWKALYVLPLVGISLALTAQTKTDYIYEEQSLSIPSDTLETHSIYVQNSLDTKVIQISGKSQDGVQIVGAYSARPADDQYFTKLASDAREMLINAEVNPDGKPIYIVDGQVQDGDFDANSINPRFIGNIDVWTEYIAIKEFGEKGKNGIVSITTKKPVVLDSTTNGSVVVNSINNDAPLPLYVIDGRVMPKGYRLKSITPEDIESLEVLKDSIATSVYGERAKDGVIRITLKKE